MQKIKEVPKDKMVGYFVVTIIAAVVVYFVIGMIVAAVAFGNMSALGRFRSF
jgi:cell division protein FtsN